MFDPVENFIEAQLKRIKFNNKSVTVYRYGPDREKGQTQYPCITFERMRYDVDYSRAIPDGIYFEPSDKQTTVTLTKYQARGGALQRTGPDHYFVKKVPIPVNIIYYINTFATRKDHSDYMQFMLMQAFPPAYMPEIDGQYPLISIHQMESQDDMSVPMFDTGGVLSVEGFWIERLSKEVVAPSIKGFNWGMNNLDETEEYI
jgi:hypothetical protein